MDTLKEDLSLQREQLRSLIERMRTLHKDNLDQRWVSLGHTHLQEGMMFLDRAIGQPDNF